MGPSWKTLPTSAPPQQTNKQRVVGLYTPRWCKREGTREGERAQTPHRAHLQSILNGQRVKCHFRDKVQRIGRVALCREASISHCLVPQTPTHNQSQLVHMRHPALHPSLTRATDSSVPDTSSATIVAKSRRDASGRNFDWVGGWTIECEQEWKRGQRRACAVRTCPKSNMQMRYGISLVTKKLPGQARVKHSEQVQVKGEQLRKAGSNGQWYKVDSLHLGEGQSERGRARGCRDQAPQRW